MKKLICFLFLVLISITFFYDRDFQDFGGDVSYVFEDYEKGVVITGFDNGGSVSQSMEINISDLSDFIDYFDMEIINTYYLDDIKVITGYSKYLNKTLPYKNGFSNLQIAISDTALVGYPQLYQGF